MKAPGKFIAGALLAAALVFSAGTASANSSFYFGFSLPLPPVYAAPAPHAYHYPGYYSGYYGYQRYYAPYPRHYRHYYHPRPYRGYYYGPYYGPHIGGWWRVR